MTSFDDLDFAINELSTYTNSRRIKPMAQNEFIQETRSKTQNEFLEEIRSNNCIVGSYSSSGGLSVNTSPAIHGSVTSARIECKRLAAIQPGKVFVILRLAGAELVPTTSISI